MSFWSFPEIPKGTRQSRGALLIIPLMFLGWLLLEFGKWLITGRP